MAAPASVPPPAELARHDALGGPRSWPWWTGLAGLVLAFVAAQVIGAVVVGIVIGLGYGTAHNPSKGANFGAFIGQDVAFVAMPIVFVVSRVGSGFAPWMVGWRRADLRRALGWIALAYLALLVFSAVWSQLVSYHEKSSVANDLPLIGGAIAADVIAPIAEETLFRGFIFASLRNKIGLAGSVAVTGLLFGAIHIGSAPAGALVPLAVFGAALCVVYWQTQSLVPCIVCHSLNNCIAYGALVHWDWQIPVTAAVSVGLILTLARVVEVRFAGRGPTPAPI